MSLLMAISIITLFAILIFFFYSKSNKAVSEQTQYEKVDAIDHLLPQTQCGDCGYKGCLPYAEAIAKNETDINRCLPGGNETVKDLARLLNKEITPLYKDEKESNVVALIDETVCIGCVKCINACPVDAIIGAPKQMHSIINQYCTGCELCIAPCPVDCISMVKAS
jgi:H+/Na+-translocating ferredoxin:NAD+ oxidoreductase subunit B